MPKRKGIGRKKALSCPPSHPDSRSRVQRKGYKRKTRVGIVAKLTGDTAFVRNTPLRPSASVHRQSFISHAFLPSFLPSFLSSSDDSTFPVAARDRTKRRASEQSSRCACAKNVGRGNQRQIAGPKRQTCNLSCSL